MAAICGTIRMCRVRACHGYTLLDDLLLFGTDMLPGLTRQRQQLRVDRYLATCGLRGCHPAIIMAIGRLRRCISIRSLGWILSVMGQSSSLRLRCIRGACGHMRVLCVHVRLSLVHSAAVRSFVHEMLIFGKVPRYAW